MCGTIKGSQVKWRCVWGCHTMCGDGCLVCCSPQETRTEGRVVKIEHQCWLQLLPPK